MEFYAISGPFHHGWYYGIWHTWQDDDASVWSDWEAFPKATSSNSFLFVQPMVVIRNEDDRQEIFTVCSDLKDPDLKYRIWHLSQDSATGIWGQWRPLADVEPYFRLNDNHPHDTIDLSLVKNDNGYMELYTISSGYSEIWYIAQTSPNQDWGTWKPLDSPKGVRFKEVITSQNKNGNVEVLALSDNWELWNRTKFSP